MKVEGERWAVAFFSQFCVGRHHGSHLKRPIMAIRHKTKLVIWVLRYFIFILAFMHVPIVENFEIC